MTPADSGGDGQNNPGQDGDELYGTNGFRQSAGPPESFEIGIARVRRPSMVLQRECRRGRV